MIGNCTICYNKPLLSFAHISSIAHRANLLRLSPDFSLMTDDEIYNDLHGAKKNVETKKRSRRMKDY